MDLFNLFQFNPYGIGIGFILIPIIIFWILFRIYSYTETDKNGRRYRRKILDQGRFCPECGLRILTKIPTCPSCGRDFSQDS